MSANISKSVMSDYTSGLDILHELEGACEYTLEPTKDNITALVASCGRAHSDITRLRAVFQELAEYCQHEYENQRLKCEEMKRLLTLASDVIAKSEGKF